MRETTGRIARVALVLWVALTACAVPAAPTSAPPAEAPRPAPGEGRLPAAITPAPHDLLGRLPLSFIENRGQTDPHVGYVLHQGASTAYFTATGVTFALIGPSEATATDALSGPARGGLPRRSALRRWAVSVDFVGADPDARPVGVGPAEAVVSYFKGPVADWKVGLPIYIGVAYRNLWPGVDLVYSGEAGRLKYDLVVRPGADPNQIKLAYRGATDVRLEGDGVLTVDTPIGGLRESAPYAFQDVDGRRVDVDAAYAPPPGWGQGGHGVSFALGAYDLDRPLVIDPAVQVDMKFLGGLEKDSANAVAVDRAGNQYIAGFTLSTEALGFPVTDGAFDREFNGSTADAVGDAFVAKLRADGSGAAYISYLGGGSGEGGSGIAVDDDGNAYVVGGTASNEDTFPVKDGPDTTFNGYWDAFIAKVAPDGGSLVYAGYIGGVAIDGATGVAVDVDRAAYLVGTTQSSQETFPDGDGFQPELTAFDRAMAGWPSGFVAKVDPAGRGLLYAGYIDGDSYTEGRAIAIDPGRNAYVTGWTTARTLSVKGGPDLSYNDPPGVGLGDAFVAKVVADGTALAYLGYIGGASQDDGNAIAVDPDGFAYVAGMTFSSQATFPDGDGFQPELTAFDRTFGGPTLGNGFVGDGFVAKVGQDGTGLVYATYLGGRQADVVRGIALGANRAVYVAGDTQSDQQDQQNSFPVRNGPDGTFNGMIDGFLAQVAPGGDQLDFAGYLGTDQTDSATAVAVGADGAAYVVGYSYVDFRTYDAWIAKVVTNPTVTPTPTPTPLATLTPTPTATPGPPGCNPRSPVHMTTAPGATGVLNVSIQAGFGSIGRIEFGASRPLSNALVSVTGGPANQSQAFTFTPPAGQTSVQFAVTSQNRALATTVHLTIVDGCGEWPTFVGGGPGAF